MNSWLILRIHFVIALAGTAGSLFFSEIMAFPPCSLCWYQRIFLYPLVLIFASAIWTEDKGYHKYAFPIAIVGFTIAAYHNLIYYGIIAEALAPCTETLSCSAKQLELLGFITIPLLSMMGFLSILALIVYDLNKNKDFSNEK